MKVQLAILAFLIAHFSADAQQYYPDNDFMGDGIGSYSIVGWMDFRDMVFQEDGKMIAGARCGNDLVLIKLNQDGSKDFDFGEGGVLRYTTGGYDIGSKILIQEDGKIVTMGYYYDDGNWDISILRFLANGLLDEAFGNSGEVRIDLSESEGADDLLLQPDGKILVVASQGSRDSLVVFRLDTDGMIDPDFADNGFFHFNGFVDEFHHSFLFQPDGKIILGGRLGGEYPDTFETNPYFILRLHPEGTIDSSFGIDGSTVIPVNYYSGKIKSITSGSDGSVLMTTWRCFAYFDLYKFNSDGILDTSFGINGLAEFDDASVIHNTYNYGVFLEDRKILLTGGDEQITLLRLMEDGTIDTSLSNSETHEMTIPFTGINSGKIILSQPDGKILIGGKNGNNAFVFTRLTTDAQEEEEEEEEDIVNTEIQDFSSLSINIFPNPASEQIHISSDHQIIQIELQSLNGEFIREWNFENKFDEIELNIGELASGIYLIKIAGKDFQQTEKLLILD
jgi:uncharacterized delta-60 repeat protein